MHKNNLHQNNKKRIISKTILIYQKNNQKKNQQSKTQNKLAKMEQKQMECVKDVNYLFDIFVSILLPILPWNAEVHNLQAPSKF